MTTVRLTHAVGWSRRFALVLLFAPLLGATQGLTIGPVSPQECQRLCNELIFDCSTGVFNPRTNNCTIVQHTPAYASGISIWTTDAECNSLRQETGTNWVFDPQGRGRGWCTEREGYTDGGFGQPDNQGACGRAPDLTREFNTQWGVAHLSRSGDTFRGYYGDPVKTIEGRLFCQGGQWRFHGTWGRTNSDRHGQVEWTFTNPGAYTFTGRYNESSNPGSWSAWNSY